MDKIAFDDIAAIQKHVSEDFGPFGNTYEVTQEKIDQFAELTGDHQWIHIDVERCKKESPFGGPIAHGFLTLSLLPKMSSVEKSDYAIVGAGNVTNYGSDKLRFLSPVPSGSKVHSRSRLVSVQGSPKGTRVEREVAIHVVGQERPALVYSSIVMFQAPRG